MATVWMRTGIHPRELENEPALLDALIEILQEGDRKEREEAWRRSHG